MKQILISSVSMIFFFITAVLAYTKINKVNYNQKENNSYLIVNYEDNVISKNIDYKEKVTSLKTNMHVSYVGDSKKCLKLVLIGDENYEKTIGVDNQNKELTFLFNGVEKEIPSFKKGDVIDLIDFVVNENESEDYEIVTKFYINKLDQNHLTLNPITFSYNVVQISC